MELLLYIVGGLVGLRVAVALIRGRWGRQAGDRWKTQSEAHRQGLFQRRREEARKAADALVERFFPHLRSAVEARLERGAQPKAALLEALKESPGVDVGTSSLRLPVILPAALRTRHVALIGKSGYGKTSVMNLLIDDSLRSNVPVMRVRGTRTLFRNSRSTARVQGPIICP